MAELVEGYEVHPAATAPHSQGASMNPTQTAGITSASPNPTARNGGADPRITAPTAPPQPEPAPTVPRNASMPVLAEANVQRLAQGLYMVGPVVCRNTAELDRAVHAALSIHPEPRAKKAGKAKPSVGVK